MEFEIPEGFIINRKKSTPHKIVLEEILLKDLNQPEVDPKLVTELSEAFNAFMELKVLRNRVNEGWDPDPKSKGFVYYIRVTNDILRLSELGDHINTLTFRRREVAKKFLEDHMDLIIKAKYFIQ